MFLDLFVQGSDGVQDGVEVQEFGHALLDHGGVEHASAGWRRLDFSAILDDIENLLDDEADGVPIVVADENLHGIGTRSGFRGFEVARPSAALLESGSQLNERKNVTAILNDGLIAGMFDLRSGKLLEAGERIEGHSHAGVVGAGEDEEGLPIVGLLLRGAFRGSQSAVCRRP